VANARKKAARRQPGPSKLRVFLSHSWKDKSVARDLAIWLKKFSFDVWFDEWQIAVGDSIVDKVFSALSTSDTLVIILSRASVKSRWVAEELSSTVMRQLSGGGIRVLPVLRETCTIPGSLRHVKYADFRKRKGRLDLLESLQPAIGLWKSLEKLFDDFCAESDRLLSRRAVSSDDIEILYEFLDEATDLRTKIELRDSPREFAPSSFFGRLYFLETKGIDTRNSVFANIVAHRAQLYHGLMADGSVPSVKSLFVLRNPSLTRKETRPAFLVDLRQLMEGFCFPNNKRLRRSRR
jgi:hypothetical protein